jgi:coenzyme F420 hydrogenase subunit beta
MENIYDKLKKDILDQGLCTHCGTCVGLSNNSLVMEETSSGPLPKINMMDEELSDLAYMACPGKGFNYPNLVNKIFHNKVKDWRMGHYEKIYIGYASDENIRRNGASGGIITTLLIYLLKEKKIDGAIVIKQGAPKPWLAKPIIATTEKEIINCAQSIYAPIPVNVILPEIKKFSGKLAFIGLPDQISSIRYLQTKKIEWLKKVQYLFGPYVGTNMYTGALKSFIKSNGYDKMSKIKSLKYRDGEWPGSLKIKMDDDKVLQSEKFYYNYLIPFYITKSSLLSVDFSNELTDISVGDAWHPKYESLGQGYSVIVARSKKAIDLLKNMELKKNIFLDEIGLKEAINMHAHMIDFKKRGSFIRFYFRRILGKSSPNFGYKPKKISLTRILIELIISTLFFISGLKVVRYILPFIPIKIIGPLFNTLRIKWKNISKEAKRKGLNKYSVIYEE